VYWGSGLVKSANSSFTLICLFLDGLCFVQYPARILMLPSISYSLDTNKVRGRKSVPKIEIDGTVGTITAKPSTQLFNPLC